MSRSLYDVLYVIQLEVSIQHTCIDLRLQYHHLGNLKHFIIILDFHNSVAPAMATTSSRRLPSPKCQIADERQEEPNGRAGVGGRVGKGRFSAWLFRMTGVLP